MAVKVQKLDLSPRERQVLRGLVDGLTNEEIGFSLGITYETAKSYIKRLRAKVGNKSRTAMAVWGDRYFRKGQ